MALRAGYYGLKRVIKDKVLNLANAAPADIGPDNPIAGKNDVLASIDLLDDTVGWLGKNKFPNKTNTVGVNIYTVDNSGYVSTSVESDGRTWSYANSNIKFTLKKGTYKVRGYEKTASTSGYTGFHILDDNDNELLIVSNWNNFMTDALTLTLAQDTNIGVEYKLGNGEYAFMIATPEQYALDESFEPHHANVEESLTVLKLSALRSNAFANNIASGGDLNSYLTPGTYNCQSGSIASGLSNCPTNVAFIMDVIDMNTAGTDKMQIIYTPNANYQRQFIVDTFSSWYKYTGTEVQATREEETKKATKKKVIKEEE